MDATLIASECIDSRMKGEVPGLCANWISRKLMTMLIGHFC